MQAGVALAVSRLDLRQDGHVAPRAARGVEKTRVADRHADIIHRPIDVAPVEKLLGDGAQRPVVTHGGLDVGHGRTYEPGEFLVGTPRLPLELRLVVGGLGVGVGIGRDRDQQAVAEGRSLGPVLADDGIHIPVVQAREGVLADFRRADRIIVLAPAEKVAAFARLGQGVEFAVHAMPGDIIGLQRPAADVHRVADTAQDLLGLVETSAQAVTERNPGAGTHDQVVVAGLFGQRKSSPEVEKREVALVGVVIFGEPLGQVETLAQRKPVAGQGALERINAGFAPRRVLAAAGDHAIETAEQLLQVGLFTRGSRSRGQRGEQRCGKKEDFHFRFRFNANIAF